MGDGNGGIAKPGSRCGGGDFLAGRLAEILAVGAVVDDDGKAGRSELRQIVQGNLRRDGVWSCG
jgi:hypothetical protein